MPSVASVGGCSGALEHDRLRFHARSSHCSAPEGWVDDLNKLHMQTKVAQAQAQRQGFEGTAAALADLAARPAWEPGGTHDCPGADWLQRY